MKIAYVNFILTKRLVGVEKKVSEQASCSPKEFDFFLLNRFVAGKNGKVTLVKIDQSGNYYDYLFRKYELIEKSIDLSGYDLVILRYPFADSSHRRFLQKYNVISEHHSDEIHELKSNIVGNSSIELRLASLVRLFLEYKYGRKYRANCKGIISVTDEIRRKESAGIRGQIPSATIPNGIDVRRIAQTGFRKLQGKAIEMIFVSSSLRPWHGLERIITSLKQYEGPYSFKLHVVGNIRPADLRIRADTNTIFHKVKEGSDLDEVFSRVNVAISSMALYLNNMREAATLKTREYTARGIPFILAYDDVDLGRVDKDKRFFLKLPNRSESIQIQEIIKFIEGVNQKFTRPSELSEYMRQYALENMDWRAKMKRYLDFCKVIEAA